MSRIYTDEVLPETSGIGEHLNLGAVGDSVTLPTGAILKTNKIADAGGNNIITSDGSGNLSVNAAAFAGDEAQIGATQTASSSAYIDFTTGFTNTYFLFKIIYTGVRPATDNTNLTWTPSTDNTNWNAVTRQWTYWIQYQGQASSGAMSYRQAWDGPSGTADIMCASQTGNDADQSSSGIVYMFNFSKSGYGAGPYVGNATKGMKNFYSEAIYSQEDDDAQGAYACGRIHASDPITGVRFKYSSGNIAAGTFKMYGLK